MTSPQRDVRWHYEVRDQANLPRAQSIKHPPCMTGQAWQRRIRRLTSSSHGPLSASLGVNQALELHKVPLAN
mgnify:CR=1 FL=1